jgi:hypothetical protein
VREVILRLLSSGMGYVALLFMLRSPDPVCTFALYLPSSILVTLAFDFGRAELALRSGLTAPGRQRVALQASLLVCGGLIGALILHATPVPARAQAVVALCVSGALQAYVDIVLRDLLFRYRRSLYMYLFQLALSAFNAAVAAAVAFGVIEAPWGLATLVALPTVAVLVYVRTLRSAPTIEACPLQSGPYASGVITALLYRAFPPAAYTAYAAALAAVAPSLASTARAFYFVFGFIHMRMMARESIAASRTRTTTLLIVCTVVMTIPLQVLSRSDTEWDWGALPAGAVLTACAAGLFAWFLHRYSRFVNDG